MSAEKKREGKPWYLQKTLWMTALAIVLYALKFFGVIDEMPDGMVVTGFAAAALNILLRGITWVFYRIKNTSVK